MTPAARPLTTSGRNRNSRNAERKRRLLDSTASTSQAGHCERHDQHPDDVVADRHQGAGLAEDLDVVVQADEVLAEASKVLRIVKMIG